MRLITYRYFYKIFQVVCVIAMLIWLPVRAVCQGDTSGTGSVPPGFKKITPSDEAVSVPDLIPEKAPPVPGIPDVRKEMRRRIEQRLDAIKKKVSTDRFRPPQWQEITATVPDLAVPRYQRKGFRMPEKTTGSSMILWDTVPPAVKKLFSPAVAGFTMSDPVLNRLLQPVTINLWAGNDSMPRSFYFPGN